MRRRRFTLTGQLLALQLAVITIVLVAVAGVEVAQSTQRFRETEGRRALSVGEGIAASRAVRAALPTDEVRFVQALAERDRILSDATSVVVARADGTIIASPDPAELDTEIDLRGIPVLEGRSWRGTRTDAQGRRVTVAMVPVYAEQRGDVIGLVAVAREIPSVLDGLRMATPNLLTYLGFASVVGVLGSLLIARRVKRQTLGLEPAEITGLVEHREALLHGIKEGILALDLQDRVTLVNDEALRLLSLPPGAAGLTLDELGMTDEARAALTGPEGRADRAVSVGGRVLVLNRMPITSRGRRIGSVTTLRDRTELLELQRELDVTKHTTDTLRAQGHEFSNRLHTISGLIELGEYEEVVRFVQRVSSAHSELTAEVTSRIRDASLAALLVAKASQASELGVDFRIDPSTTLDRLEDQLSADVATVVGNLVDNALDAISGTAGPWVQVALMQVDGSIRVAVRDSGPGVPGELAEEIFRRGVTTKDGQVGRGIGLALVHLVCARRDGFVTVSNDDGAVFVASLPEHVEVRP